MEDRLSVWKIHIPYFSMSKHFHCLPVNILIHTITVYQQNQYILVTILHATSSTYISISVFMTYHSDLHC